MIASSGYKANAPAPGRTSFTHELIEELIRRASSSKTFDTTALRYGILQRVIQGEIKFGQDMLLWSATPIYINLNENHCRTSILLKAFRNQNPVFFPYPRSDILHIDGMGKNMLKEGLVNASSGPPLLQSPEVENGIAPTTKKDTRARKCQHLFNRG
jgi:hypothetical protein